MEPFLPIRRGIFAALISTTRPVDTFPNPGPFAVRRGSLVLSKSSTSAKTMSPTSKLEERSRRLGLLDRVSQKQAALPRTVLRCPQTIPIIQCQLFDRQQGRPRAESTHPLTGPQRPCFRPLPESQCKLRISGSLSCTRCRQEDDPLLLEAPQEPPLALVLREAPITATSRSIPSSE